VRTYGTVTLSKGSWVIRTEPHVLIRLKRVFGRVERGEHDAVHLTDTAETCREILWFLDRFPMKVRPRKHLVERARAYIEHTERLHAVIQGGYEPRPFTLAVPARPYQTVAAEVTLQAGSLLLADDLGCGKTAAAIAVMTDPKSLPALVVAPTHLQRQWERELKKFAPGLRVHILKKGTPYDLTRGRNATLPGFNALPDVIISSYHKLSGWAATLAGHVRGIFFDEAQELRRPDSFKYRAAKHIAERATVRMGLSATPIYNLGSEAWNLLQVLSPDALGTREEFIREWCLDANHSGEYKIRDPKAFGLYLRERGLMLRRTRAELGRELPPLTRIPHVIDIDEKPLGDVQTAADELARIILTQGGQQRPGEKLHASEELSWRLRQATGIAKAPHVAAFVRMLVEQGEKVLLAGWHREVYALWLERLKDLDPVMFTGSESATQKAASVERFTKGDASVFIISLRAGAGLDGLQGVCRTVVHGELDWSPAVHHQVDGRPHRDGQTEPVTAYYLVAEAGSDPVIAEVLNLKEMQIQGIRDPNAPLIEPLAGGAANVRRLAEEYLRQRGLELPQPSSDTEVAEGAA
jgi:SNF2 family DNA or RNA helicase